MIVARFMCVELILARVALRAEVAIEGAAKGFGRGRRCRRKGEPTLKVEEVSIWKGRRQRGRVSICEHEILSPCFSEGENCVTGGGMRGGKR